VLVRPDQHHGSGRCGQAGQHLDDVGPPGQQAVTHDGGTRESLLGRCLLTLRDEEATRREVGAAGEDGGHDEGQTGE